MEQISSIKNIYKHKNSKMSEAKSFVGHSPHPNYNLFDGDSVEYIDKPIFQNNLLLQSYSSYSKSIIISEGNSISRFMIDSQYSKSNSYEDYYKHLKYF